MNRGLTPNPDAVPELALVQTLGIMVIAAALLVLAGRLVRAPSIVVYILAGLLLGPIGGVVESTEAIHVIGEVGIVLLLFVVGMELSLEKIRDVGRVAVVAGFAQMTASFLGALLLARLFGIGGAEALILAVALSLSSTVVVVKLLDQKKELHRLHGRISVGVLLIQDLVVIVVLTFLAGLGREQSLETGAMLRGVGGAFGGMALLLLAALVASRYVLPPVMKWIAPASDALFIWSLFWCFLLVLAAEGLHLSPEIGAFLAGLSLAQLPYSHGLRRRVHPLMNFFIAVFFISLGLEMDLAAAIDGGGRALGLAAFILLSRVVVLYAVLRGMGYGARPSFLVGVTLSQISEFSLILMALAREVGMAGEMALALVAVVALVTIAVSSYLILGSSGLYGWLRRRGVLPGGDESDADAEEPGLHGHVIVVGMNTLGVTIVEELIARGEKVLAIDTDVRKLADLPCHSLVGNAEDPVLMEEANLPEARLLVSALQIEESNYLLAYRAMQHGIPSSIHAFDQSVVPELRSIGVSHLLISKNIGIQRIAQQLRAMGVLGR